MIFIILETVVRLVACLGYWAYDRVRNFFPEHFYKSIDGETVLITGGGSGIGRLIAIKMASLGATVVTIDVNEKGNDETVRMIRKDGNKAYGFVCDLSNKDEIYSVANTVTNQVGNISILINNAGIVSGTSLLETSDEKIQRTMNVNVLAHFWTIKCFLPQMISAKKGHIVTVASIAGLAGTNKLVDYCASKFANVGMHDALQVELVVQGLDSDIKTTLVCPYYISTGMFAGVQSMVVPILEPEYVADEVVKAIRTNKPEVILPWWAAALAILKTMLPSVPFIKLSQTLGFNCSMDQFEGRNTKKIENVK